MRSPALDMADGFKLTELMQEVSTALATGDLDHGEFIEGQIHFITLVDLGKTKEVKAWLAQKNLELFKAGRANPIPAHLRTSRTPPRPLPPPPRQDDDMGIDAPI